MSYLGEDSFKIIKTLGMKTHPLLTLCLHHNLQVKYVMCKEKVRQIVFFFKATVIVILKYERNQTVYQNSY